MKPLLDTVGLTNRPVRRQPSSTEATARGDVLRPEDVEMTEYAGGRARSGSTVYSAMEPADPGKDPPSWMEYRASINPVEKGFETRYLTRTKTPIKVTIQGKVYNFLERPTGWKCFIYHFTV